VNANAGDGLAEVRILGFPVQLQARAQEHMDDLLREFMLIAAANEQDPSSHVPRQLLELIQEVQSDYAGFTSEQAAQVVGARESGLESLDLVYRVPTSVAKAAMRLGEALDEADGYCLAGDHLLTLAAPPQVLELRRWYLGEFIAQIAGAPPTAWPDRIATNRRQ
jgi:hypothetical protein